MFFTDADVMEDDKGKSTNHQGKDEMPCKYAEFTTGNTKQYAEASGQHILPSFIGLEGATSSCVNLTFHSRKTRCFPRLKRHVCLTGASSCHGFGAIQLILFIGCLTG